MTITFILGAGASMDYGFPSGNALYELISDHPIWKYENRLDQIGSIIDQSFEDEPDAGLSSNDVQRMLMNVQSGDVSWMVSQDTRGFFEVLRRSASYSIDYFLQENSQWLQLGKFFIAEVISRFEYLHLIAQGYNPNLHGWYRDFLSHFAWIESQMHASESPIQLNIINFNYDRSFENYLKTIGPSTYSFWNRILKSTYFSYVYGNLGPLKEDGENLLDAYSPAHSKYLKSCYDKSDYISIVHEPGPETHLEFIRSRLAESDKVYILGFGFHPVNTDRLFKDLTWKKDPEFIATALGRSDGEIEMIKALSHGHLDDATFVNGTVKQVLQSYPIFGVKGDYSLYHPKNL